MALAPGLCHNARMQQKNDNVAKIKSQSPLVQTVLALDHQFAELERLSAKINDCEMKSDSDFEQLQHLMGRFSECGNAISGEVVQLSQALNDARASAEAAAQKVGARAEQLQAWQGERQKKMLAFHQLGEKVKGLTGSLQELRRPEGVPATDEDRARIAKRLSELETELAPLIEEAQAIKEDAARSRMRELETGAHALGQSLRAMSTKLGSLQPGQVLQ